MLCYPCLLQVIVEVGDRFRLLEKREIGDLHEAQDKKEVFFDKIGIQIFSGQFCTKILKSRNLELDFSSRETFQAQYIFWNKMDRIFRKFFVSKIHERYLFFAVCQNILIMRFTFSLLFFVSTFLAQRVENCDFLSSWFSAFRVICIK